MTKYEILDELYKNSVNYATRNEKNLRDIANESRKPKSVWMDVYGKYKEGKVDWVFATHILTGIMCYTTPEQKQKLGIRQ